MTKRHKHADLIHAWAEGAFIQISLNGILVDCFDSPDCSFNSSLLTGATQYPSARK